VKAELQKLIALQNLDTTIRKLEKDQQATPERRAEIEREFDQRAFEIRALENRRDEAKHTRARLENEVMEQKGRAERAERNLMSSKKPDEYTAAIREADAARKQISGLETQILEQMEQLEQAEGSLKERADEIASMNSDREAKLKAFDEQTGTIGDRLAAARKERDEVFANLPKQMSGLYTRIKTRIRDGVAVADPDSLEAEERLDHAHAVGSVVDEHRVDRCLRVEREPGDPGIAGVQVRAVVMNPPFGKDPDNPPFLEPREGGPRRGHVLSVAGDGNRRLFASLAPMA